MLLEFLKFFWKYWLQLEPVLWWHNHLYLYPSFSNIGNIYVMHIHLQDRHVVNRSLLSFMSCVNYVIYIYIKKIKFPTFCLVFLLLFCCFSYTSSTLLRLLISFRVTLSKVVFGQPADLFCQLVFSKILITFLSRVFNWYQSQEVFKYHGQLWIRGSGRMKPGLFTSCVICVLYKLPKFHV